MRGLSTSYNFSFFYPQITPAEAPTLTYIGGVPKTMGCCSSKPEGDGREMSPRSAVAVKRQSRTRVGPQGDTQDSSDLKRITEKIERSHKTKVLNLENELLLTVPSGVGLIEGLRAVDVSRNKLTDVSPDFFDRSRTTLKKLGCGHNRIAKFPVGTFPALTHLVLTHNSLTETPDLTDYVCLKELDVSNNMISTIGPLPPSLTTIDLQGNRVSELPDTIFSLKNLHTLDLSKNRLLKFCSEEDVC